jgi:hypothetical protein
MEERQIQKIFQKSIEDLLEEIRKREEEVGAIKPCLFCGGSPAFTKERYVDLCGFNHTCKGKRPQIHIKSDGYHSLEDAAKMWNNLMTTDRHRPFWRDEEITE